MQTVYPSGLIAITVQPYENELIKIYGAGLQCRY